MAGNNHKDKVPIIRTVVPLDHYQLHIEFGSGSILDLSMANRLCTNRYYDLSNDEIFYSAVTDGSKIIFDTGTHFTLEISAREAIDRAIRNLDGSMGIQYISPLGNGQLCMEMRSGSILTLNMEYWLSTIRYSPLKEPGVLQLISTDGENLFFGDILTIDMEELIKLTLIIPPDRKKNDTIQEE